MDGPIDGQRFAKHALHSLGEKQDFQANVERAIVIKPRSDEGVKKHSSASERPGNCTELVVAGTTKRVNMGSEGKFLVQGDTIEGHRPVKRR